MFQQFHEAVQAVIKLLQKKGYSDKTTEEIRRYEREFEKYLSALDKPYDFNTVIYWLERRKTKWSPDTYNRYRRAAYRVQQYMDTGKIIDTSYHPGGSGCYVYHDMPAAFAHLPENWRNEFRCFNEYSRLHYERTTIDHHRVPAARFMLFLAENGCAEPSECTAHLMIRFHDIIESVDCSEDKKTKYNNVFGAHEFNRAIARIIRDYNEAESTFAERDQRSPILIPHFMVHNLRHTFCTRFCENETNLKVIQEIMGHADISTTMDIYNEATREKKMESFANLEGKIKLC